MSEKSMTDTPPSMRNELGAWDGGTEVDLATWITGAGSLRLAVGYSTVFWPRFRTVDKYILRGPATLQQIRDWEAAPGSTPRSVEATLNHLHMVDIHYSNEDASPDKLVFLGNVLKEIYQAKLAWQFPDRPCKVEFGVPTNEDDLAGYELTFWQKAFDN